MSRTPAQYGRLNDRMLISMTTTQRNLCIEFGGAAWLRECIDKEAVSRGVGVLVRPRNMAEELGERVKECSDWCSARNLTAPLPGSQGLRMLTEEGVDRWRDSLLPTDPMYARFTAYPDAKAEALHKLAKMWVPVDGPEEAEAPEAPPSEPEPEYEPALHEIIDTSTDEGKRAFLQAMRDSPD